LQLTEINNFYLRVSVTVNEYITDASTM